MDDDELTQINIRVPRWLIRAFKLEAARLTQIRREASPNAVAVKYQAVMRDYWISDAKKLIELGLIDLEGEKE